MKKNNFWSLLLTTVLSIGMSMSFVSCSSDDDNGDDSGNNGGNLSAPTYATQAKLLNITDEDSPYASIEFTESGLYLIKMKYEEEEYAKALRPAVATSTHFLANWQKGSATRSIKDGTLLDNGIIYGHYTMRGENVYILNGFGTVELKSDGGSAVALVITPNDGNSYTLTASVRKTEPDNDLTTKMCRTWSFDKFRVVLNSKVIKVDFDKTYPWTLEGVKMFQKDYEPIAGRLTDDPEDDFFVYFADDFYKGTQAELITCTKAGTYMVLYADQSLAISTWGWDKNVAGLMRYSWDYDYLYDEEESGVVQVSFDDEYFMVKEDVWDHLVDEEEFSGVGYIMYYGKEVK